MSEENTLPIEDLSRIPMEVAHLIVGASAEPIVVLKANNQLYAQIVDSYLSSHLAFIKGGYSENAHIKTIYQIYLGTMEDLGIKLESVTLSAVDGDVIYATLEWKTSVHRTLCVPVISLGDALILHEMTKAPLFIVKKVLDQLDPADDWVAEMNAYDDEDDY